MKNIVKKLRKGFTIVELVIVIAVIAILAAVLIPTLANVIDQAEESNDIQTVSQLNTIASAYATVGEIETVNDALDGALENGYSVSALTPTSEGNVIVYDATSNRFALLSKDLTTVVYKDSATTKEDAEDWQTSTTWVIVTTSDVTLVDNVYTLTGSNSYVLVGDDWNGASVTAEYGVSLYDYKGTTTLGKLVIKNEDDENSQQTIKAEDSTSSKSTVAKTTTANNTKVSSITVNVKAAYLSCSANVYTIKNYSTTTITAVVGNSQLAEYGTTSVYDASQIGSNGKITNYNKNISEDVIVKVAEGQKAEDVLVDNTKTITVSAVATTTVEITVTTTSSTTVSITVDGSEIVSTDTTDGTTTITADLSGTSLKPYEISKASDLLDMESGCYKLVAEELETSSAVTIDADTDVTIDLNGNTLTISGYTSSSNAALINNGTLTLTSSAEGGILYAYGNTVYAVSGISNKGTLTIKDNATISSYYYTIANYGTLSVYGTIEATKSTSSSSARAVYNNSGTVNIEDGAYLYGYYGLYNYVGTANIEGGKVSGYYAGAYNTGYSSGSEDEGYTYIGGTLNVSGGEITASGYTYTYGIYNLLGSLNITGGEITAGYIGVRFGSYCADYTLNISGETTTISGNWGVYTETGTLIISNGTITGTAYQGVRTASTTTISGGEIAGAGMGIYATAALTVSGDTVVKCENDVSGWIYGIYVDTAGSLTVSGNVNISAKNNSEDGDAAGIVYWGNSNEETPVTIVVNGGTIEGTTFGMSGNGSASYSKVTITGGTITGGGLGIYHPENGTMTISGDTQITGSNSAIEIRSGSLIISGGTFIATAEELSVNYNGSGTTIIGAAIAVSQHTTQNAITVDISGGTFTGYYALYETDTVTTVTPLSDNVTITISGTAVLNATADNATNGYYSENDKVTDNRTTTSD